MAKFYDYVLAVWLRFEGSRPAQDLQEELQEYLEAEYQVNKLEVVEELESGEESEPTFSLHLQLTFPEAQMDGDGPTEGALGELYAELRAYLEARYPVSYLELLDDALTSYLLAERDEPEDRNYPEPKQRDLTPEEKSQLRARIERGDSDIYLLAKEFGCSSSQVAGIKAAMHR